MENGTPKTFASEEFIANMERWTLERTSSS
jgi:hypothetical protein